MVLVTLLILCFVLSVCLVYGTRNVMDGIGSFIICALMTLLVSPPIFMLIGSKWVDKYTYMDSVSSPIVSLKTDKSLNGSFTLGTGYIQSTEQYIFVRALGNSQFYRDSAPIWQTIIKEDDNVAPAYVYDRVLCTVDPRWRYLVPISWLKNNYIEYRNHRLVVPSGTIVTRFEVK